MFSFLPPGPQPAPLSKGLQNVWSASMLSHIHCISPEDPLCIKGCARLCPAQKDPLHVPEAASARELWNSLVKAQLKPQLRSNILPGQDAALQSPVYKMDKSQCCAMEAPYKMAEDLRLSILRDSRVSQFLFILMARLVLKKLYFILLHVWPLRQLGSLMYLQKAQSYIHTYRISVINLRFLFSSPDLLCKLTC